MRKWITGAAAAVLMLLPAAGTASAATVMGPYPTKSSCKIQRSWAIAQGETAGPCKHIKLGWIFEVL